MRINMFKYLAAVTFCLVFFAQRSDAQFKEGAFTQNYNDASDTTGRRDTVEKMFSLKEYFGGLSHKNKLKVGTMTAGSAVFIGGSQIYNKDYWKLPIVYGGIGSLAGTGGYYLHKYSKSQKEYDKYMNLKTAYETENGTEYPCAAPAIDTKSKKTGTWLMVGAGIVYWGTLLDGVISYESDTNPDPGRATLYSLLFPGLGQIYNGELFKVPIYWGCLLGSTYFLTTYNTNYKRFKRPVRTHRFQAEFQSPEKQPNGTVTYTEDTGTIPLLRQLLSICCRSLTPMSLPTCTTLRWTTTLR